MNLRPYQRDALQAVKDRAASGVTKQLIKLPTGMGKTVIFSGMPDSLSLDKKMLVLVHREELASQAYDKVKKWNPNRSVGVEMGARHSKHSDDIIIGSVQTLGTTNGKRLSAFDPQSVGLLVIDEAHHATSQSYRRIIEHFNTLVVGLTATPNRADGKGLGEVFQEIVYDKSILESIREGWLSDLRGIRVKTSTNLDAVHTKGGDFDEQELSGSVNTPARNDLAVRSWLEHGQNRQTIAFTVDIAHAKAMADTFKRYGIAAEAIWGDDPHRKEKLDYHREGKLKVLVNCQLLTEGYDDWRIGCIVLARPTKSESLYTQIVGRGTRIPEGVNNLVEARQQGIPLEKEDCILIDLVDVTSKHSLVTLPSLFGLNKDADLKGKSITQVMDVVEKIKKQKPQVSLDEQTDVDKFESYAEQVDLFKIATPPEVIQISEFQWHKTQADNYVLKLAGPDNVTVLKDMLDKWHIVGKVNQTDIHETHTDFDAAIKDADYMVRMLGGKGAAALAKRDAKWRKEPPTDAQLAMFKKFRVPVPEGMTKGDAKVRLDKLFDDLKQSRLQHALKRTRRVA